jgi:diguanylate cyclase (GGDEF)-like protein
MIERILQGSQILPALLPLLVGLVVLFLLLLRSRWRIRQLQEDTRRLKAVSLELQKAQQSQKLMKQFLREFSQLSVDLHECSQVRRVPNILLKIVLRLAQSPDALVLIRRKPTSAHPERDRQLIVTAAGPSGTDRIGRVISIGRGELGMVAESQLVADRQILDRVSPSASSSRALSGFRADLAAPMVVGRYTLGVLALSAPHRLGSHGKEILRLIAQTGADKLKSTRALSQIRAVADADPLTGIYNKRVLTYRLGELIYEAETTQGTLSVFIFDIDHFKNYNDVNGHVAGDNILQSLCRLVEERVRVDDIFGRFGGEEFLLILPARSAKDAKIVADKIRLAISSHDFPYGNRQPLGRITISGGVASFPEHANDSARLLRVADAALYEAKAAGRNEIRIASEGVELGVKPEPEVLELPLTVGREDSTPAATPVADPGVELPTSPAAASATPGGGDGRAETLELAAEAIELPTSPAASRTTPGNGDSLLETVEGAEVDIELPTVAVATNVGADNLEEEEEVTREYEIDLPAAPSPASSPSDGDDLRAIRGIGPAFERSLHEAGISCYRQIAHFHDFGLEAVASLLSVKPNRILRDRWIEQAKELHLEKYGEQV